MSIKFEVLNRFSGAVQFAAKIDCPEDAPRSHKLRLAVMWAIKEGANLRGANLARANLADACLADACLAGAIWQNGVVIQQAPILIDGLSPYRVIILDSHMQIGCELHTLADWEAFDDRRIIEMDGRDAARFWSAHRDGVLAIARGAGRDFEAVAKTEDAA